MTSLWISLITAAVVAFLAVLGFILRELVALRVSVTAIHEQVLPENAPSLSSTVNTHTVQLAVLESHFPTPVRS